MGEIVRGWAKAELLALPEAPAASAAIEMRPTNGEDLDGVD